MDKLKLNQAEMNVLIVALEHMEEHLIDVQDEVDVSWQIKALETLKDKVLYTK